VRQQRLDTILELAAQEGHVTVAQVREHLGTSVATARRDLGALAQQRLVVRTHGGASALAGRGYGRSLAEKATTDAGARAAVARATCALITVGDVVGLDGGTTTTEVARELARADHLVAADGTRGFTLVTNALDVAVLGVEGVDARFGATTADAGEADIGRTLAAAARRVVVAPPEGSGGGRP